MAGPRERAEPPRDMIFLVLAVWRNGAHVVGPRNMRLEKELFGDPSDPSRTWEVMFRAKFGNSDRERAVILLVVAKGTVRRRLRALFGLSTSASSSRHLVYDRIRGIMLDDAVSFCDSDWRSHHNSVPGKSIELLQGQARSSV